MGIQFDALDSRRTRRTFAGDEVPVSVELPDAWSFYGLNVVNGPILLAMLREALGRRGGEAFADHTYGLVELAIARRAVIAARARFATFQATALRASADAAAWCEAWGGRVISGPALDVEGLRERLETFAAFVEVAAEAGATHVRWS